MGKKKGEGGSEILILILYKPRKRLDSEKGRKKKKGYFLMFFPVGGEEKGGKN